MSQLFRYIERRDGRAPLNRVNTCSKPLMRGEHKIYSTQGKCDLLAEYFEERFRAPPCATPEEQADQNNFLQTWNRWQPLLDIPEVQELEALKAAGGMEGNRAAGPDEIPIEIYQNMPSLRSIISKLFTVIFRTGVSPKGMLKVYIAPLDKPGKDGTMCTSKRPISLLSVLA